MKFFIVIYMLGNVAGVEGPIPITLNECRSTIIEMQLQAEQTFKDGLSVSYKGKMLKIEDVTFKCETKDPRK